jgi:hypothetical protein
MRGCPDVNKANGLLELLKNLRQVEQPNCPGRPRCNLTAHTRCVTCMTPKKSKTHPLPNF